MANTEKTFADRRTRAGTMQTKIAGFVPAFAPADVSLAPMAFDDFLESTVDPANLDVAVAGAAATSATNLRRDLMLQIKERATRAVNYVGSNGAWDQFLPAVKQAADKVRNFKPTKKAALPPPPGAPPVKPRMTGQQSFGDVDGLFEKLIEAIKLVPGYAPTPESLIQTATLSTLQTNYRAANKSVATTGAASTKAERARKAIYDGAKDSLRTKMKAIKKATRSQYGASSAEFGQVKGIAL